MIRSVKTKLSEEDLSFGYSVACGDHPESPVLSNSIASYYDCFRKTEFSLKIMLNYPIFGIMIKGAAELDNTDHMGWFSKHISTLKLWSHKL